MDLWFNIDSANRMVLSMCIYWRQNTSMIRFCDCMLLFLVVAFGHVISSYHTSRHTSFTMQSTFTLTPKLLNLVCLIFHQRKVQSNYTWNCTTILRVLWRKNAAQIWTRSGDVHEYAAVYNHGLLFRGNLSLNSHAVTWPLITWCVCGVALVKHCMRRVFVIVRFDVCSIGVPRLTSTWSCTNVYVRHPRPNCWHELNDHLFYMIVFLSKYTGCVVCVVEHLVVGVGGWRSDVPQQPAVERKCHVTSANSHHHTTLYTTTSSNR